MRKCIYLCCIVAVASGWLTFSAGSARADGKKLNIAMVLWRGGTAAEKGFKAELDRLGYAVDYTIVNADQDIRKLADIVRKENKFDGYDYVYSFGTTVSKFLARVISSEIPMIFNIVTAPVEARIIKSMGPRERNICGVSNRVLPELAIQNAFNVAAFKKLGLFYNPREKNSKISLTWIIKLGSQMGFEVIPLRCPPEGPLFKENLEKVTSRSIDVDAVYLPSDSFLASRAEDIGKALQRTRIISIGAIRQFIEKGVMLGTVPDYYNMGTMAAGILDRHQRGEKLSDIPVQIPENPALIINTTTADRLGIKIDRSLLEKAIIVK